jgi:hypothetical protein
MASKLLKATIKKNSELGYYMSKINKENSNRSEMKKEFKKLQQEPDYKNLTDLEKNELFNYFLEIIYPPTNNNPSRPSQRGGKKRRTKKHTRKIKNRSRHRK